MASTPHEGSADRGPGRPSPGASEATRRVIRTLIPRLAGLLGALCVVAIVVSWMADAGPGARGAAIGCALGVLFAGVDCWVMWATSRRSVGAAMGAMVVGWVVKMGVVLAVTIPLRSVPSVSLVCYAVAVAVTLVGAIAVEMITLARARTAYVDDAQHR